MATHESPGHGSVSQLLGHKHPERSADKPERFQLVRPHGFIDEHGRRHHWNAGEIVSGADAKLLQERKAELRKLED